MQKLPEPIVLRDWSGGVNNSFSNALTPDNALRYAINMYSDPMDSNYGSLVSRGGIDVQRDYTGSGSNIFGLFSPSTDNVLVALLTSAANTYVKISVNGAALTDIGGSPFNWYTTLDNNIRFCQYLGYTFACNGTYIKSWDGDVTHDWGSTNISSAPVGQLITEFQGRLYVSQNSSNPSRVYFSKLPSSGALPAWDSSVDYFDVAPNDGDDIVALEKNGNILLIFKRRSTYYYDGTTLYLLAGTVGAISQESVQTINGKTLFIFKDKRGNLHVYLYNNGSYPVRVSDQIKAWLKCGNSNTLSISPSHLGDGNRLGTWVDENNYFVGIDRPSRNDYFKTDISFIDASAQPCIALRLNLDTNTWNEVLIAGCVPYFSTRMLTSDAFTVTILGVASLYGPTGNTRYALLRWDNSSSSNVYKSYQDKIGSTSATWPIYFHIETKELEFGSRGRKKQLNKFFVYVDGDYGEASIFVRADKGSWDPLGGFQGKITTLEYYKQGYIFEFRIVGQTNKTGSGGDLSGGFVFDGFEFPNVDIEDYES